MRSEALSTACLVLGVDAGLDLCHTLRASAILLTASGEIRATPGLAPRVSLRAGIQAHLRRPKGLGNH
jgi:thiamine biosynthesis lipoprotein ApbE